MRLLGLVWHLAPPCTSVQMNVLASQNYKQLEVLLGLFVFVQHQLYGTSQETMSLCLL